MKKTLREKMLVGLRYEGLENEKREELLKTFEPYLDKIYVDPRSIYELCDEIRRVYLYERITAEDWYNEIKELDHVIQNPPKETDFYRLKELFDSFGIEYTIKRVDRSKGIIVCIEAGSEKVKGYGGFVSDYNFDETGAFKEVGIWE